jgi:hypothetical protein
MPLVENIASFANYNTNCGLENTQFGRFINLIDGSLGPEQHNGVIYRRSGNWNIINNDLIYENQIKNLGDIHGNKTINFNNSLKIIGTLTSDVNFYAVGKDFINETIYTFKIIQGGAGNYSLNWPFGSKVIGQINKSPSAQTIIQLYQTTNTLFIKNNVFTNEQPIGAPVILWQGNILLNNPDHVLIKVNGSVENIGEEIAGNNGGIFVINADGYWTFDPAGDFEGIESEPTSVSYTLEKNGDTFESSLFLIVNSNISSKYVSVTYDMLNDVWL